MAATTRRRKTATATALLLLLLALATAAAADEAAQRNQCARLAHARWDKERRACVCEPGWTGPMCVLNECSHAGRWNATSNTCECAFGYAGDTCERCERGTDDGDVVLLCCRAAGGTTASSGDGWVPALVRAATFMMLTTAGNERWHCERNDQARLGFGCACEPLRAERDHHHAHEPAALMDAEQERLFWLRHAPPAPPSAAQAVLIGSLLSDTVWHGAQTAFSWDDINVTEVIGTLLAQATGGGGGGAQPHHAASASDTRGGADPYLLLALILVSGFFIVSLIVLAGVVVAYKKVVKENKQGEQRKRHPR
jgi:hypothetical protein